MVLRRNPESGRHAVLLLATALVVLLGAGACAFIIVAAVEQPSWDLLKLSGMFAGVILLLAILSITRDRRQGNGWLRLWMTIRGKSDPKTVLRIGRKKPLSSSTYGTNSPPTLESVRESADQKIQWVPHGPPPERTPRSH